MADFWAQVRDDNLMLRITNFKRQYSDNARDKSHPFCISPNLAE